jgi:hypothetical protein
MLPHVLTLKLTQQASCSLSLSVLRKVWGTGAILPSKVCAFEKFGQRAQWHVPHTFHNVMVFMMCNTNGHVDFEQWLGQVDPRRPVHCEL